jgi:hypothetical protein
MRIKLIHHGGQLVAFNQNISRVKLGMENLSRDFIDETIKNFVAKVL